MLFAFFRPTQKMGTEGPKWGQEDFFPTSPDLADILGGMDLDFENFIVSFFFGVPHFWLGPTWGRCICQDLPQEAYSSLRVVSLPPAAQFWGHSMRKCSNLITFLDLCCGFRSSGSKNYGRWPKKKQSFKAHGRSLGSQGLRASPPDVSNVAKCMEGDQKNQ